MNKDTYIIKTSELYVIPDSESAPEGASRWEKTYNIFLREKKKIKDNIGYMKFEGAPVLGAVTLNLFIGEKFRNRGYGRELLKDMLEWCFCQRDVYEVKIDIPTDSDAALHLVQKTPFVFRGKEKGTEHYSAIKQKTSWLGLYILIGVIVGSLLGILLSNFFVGIPSGIIAGLLAGGIMDSGENKRREEIMGRKERKVTFGKEKQ